MTYKVGPKGQVVLPKAIRERLGIEPGDEVTVEEDEGSVRIQAVGRTSLWGALGPSEVDPLELLEADHRWEIERDEARIKRLTQD